MKKFFIVLLAIILVVACAFSFTACNLNSSDSSENNNNQCSHYYKFNYVDSNTHSGECSNCHDTIIEQHSMSNNNCSKCGYDRTREEYIVTFDANEGVLNGSATQTVKFNSLLTEPVKPTYEGYVFGGWAIEKDGSKLWDFAIDKVSNNFTLYAKWIKILFVKFNANGGEFIDETCIHSIEVKEGDRLDTPETPTRASSEFTHWYKDDTLTEKWDFNTDIVTNDITLYAGWKVLENEVTFVLNYADVEDVIELTVNGLVTFFPTREGYVFNGWWRSEGQTADGSYILTQKWDIMKIVDEKKLVLYAEWVEESTVTSQLSAPSVSINGNIFSWDSIQDAVHYDLRIYKSGSYEEIASTNVAGTSWTFPNSYEAGYYNVKIRAIGDGLNNVNSSYVTKSYGHLILGDISSIEFDISNSMLTWSPIKNAMTYEIYVNNQLVDAISYSTYDLSELDAGDYEIKIVAKRENYQSSTATKTIVKKRLKTPDINIFVDKDTLSYVLSWDAIKHANVYIINFDGVEIKINDNYYVFDNNSEIWNNQPQVNFSVNAYDSNADYLISNNYIEYNVAKLYLLSVEKSAQNAGDVIIDGELYINESKKISQTFVVKFNLNDGTSNYNSQVVTSSEGLSYPDIPIRSGYVFKGWYTEKECLNIYDFTSKIGSNISLYASWYEIPNSNSSVININQYDSDSNVYSTSNNNTSSTKCKYIYFAALTSGTFYLYFSNQTAGYNYSTSFYVYNVTQDVVIQDTIAIEFSSYSAIAVEAEAGDIFYIKIYKRNTSSSYSQYTCNFRVFFDGANLPKAGGKCDYKVYLSGEICSADNEVIVTYGTQLTLSATSNSDYTWHGWYNGNSLISSELNCDFTMTDQNINIFAKWETNVQYIDSEGDIQWRTSGDVEILQTTSDDTLSGWYLLTGETSINISLKVIGEAHVILADYCNWTVDNIDVADGSSLYIYAQSNEDRVGELVVSGNIGGIDGKPGADGKDRCGEDGYCGQDSGIIIINGGNISAKNIGGGNGGNGGKGADFTNYFAGGKGGNGGKGGAGGYITINEGTITAANLGGGNGGNGGAGGAHGIYDIENSGAAGGAGGTGGFGGTIIINGGIINVTYIGGGAGGYGYNGGVGLRVGGTGGVGGAGGDGNIITINSGSVTATRIGGGNGGAGGVGGAGASGNGRAYLGGKGGAGGIGGAGGNITINSGSVNATRIGGGNGGAGGAGGTGGGNRSSSSGSRGANGGAAGFGGIGGASGNIELNGGEIINAYIGSGNGGTGGSGGSGGSGNATGYGGAGGRGGAGGNIDSILIVNGLRSDTN